MAMIVDDDKILWHKKLNNKELIQVCDFNDKLTIIFELYTSEI